MKRLISISLLFLQVVFIQRCSSRSLVTFEEIKAVDPTIQGMTEGTDLFINVMVWMKENVKSSIFDEKVKNLENAIVNLPSSVGVDKAEILRELYSSQNKIRSIRVVLEDAAIRLKGYTNEIIEIYERNDPDEGVLKYGAKKFIDYSNRVLVLLDKGLKDYAVIQKSLENSKSLLVTLTSKIAEQKEVVDGLKRQEEKIKQNILQIQREIEEIRQKAADTEKFIDDFEFGFTIGTAGLGYAFVKPASEIAKAVEANKADKKLNEKNIDLRGVQNQLLDNELKLVKLETNLKTAKDTADDLIREVAKMNKYVLEEKALIHVWKTSLTTSIEDTGSVSADDIKYGVAIDGIKSRLHDLIKACDDYINHSLPDIFN